MDLKKVRVNKTLLNKQANFNTWVKIKFIHPSVYKDKRMSAEITVFIGCAQMFSSRMNSRVQYWTTPLWEAILEKGSLKSFICFSYHLMFYFFLKKNNILSLINRTVPANLYVYLPNQSSSNANGHFMHTVAYSNLSSANPAQYWIHGGLFKI